MNPNLEEIKNKWDGLHYPELGVNEVNWLIADIIKSTANLCAEIAEHFDDLEDPDDDGLVYGADVAEAIRNAFGLEAPDGKD